MKNDDFNFQRIDNNTVSFRMKKKNNKKSKHRKKYLKMRKGSNTE